MIKPKEERLIVRRDYVMVECLLRELFSIPSDEAVLDLVWDKNIGILRLTTLLDSKEVKNDNNQRKN